MAMSLSLAVTAGAAFNDQDKIVNTEAVDMCVALNIINGYKDGSYKPEGTITRAEACKMIAVALNGGETPTTSVKEVPSFTDINGNWAEAFIEYCFAKGIVDGVGDDKFNPNGLLTGAQYAKMLLVALGYNADVEKYVGATWDLYVNVQANQDGIYDELSDLDPADPLNRDDAAQMTWNALNAKVIEKSSSIDRVTGDIVDIYEKGKENLLAVAYGTTTSDAALLTRVEQDTVKGTYNLYIKDGDRDETKADYTKVAYDYSELVGQNVKVVYTAADEVFGVFADEDSSVIAEGIVGQLALDDAASDESIELDGTDYALDQDADDTTCMLMRGRDSSKDLDEVMADNTRDAWTVKLIDIDGDGKVNHAVMTQVDIEKVTYVSNTAIRANGVAYDFDDHNIYSGVAKNDYAIIVNADDTVDGKAVITKADVVTGEVTAKDGNDVRVDGSWYERADNCSVPAIDYEVDMVVYGDMYFAWSFSVDALNVAVVTGVGNYDRLADTMKVELLLQNGDADVVVDVENWDGDITNANYSDLSKNEATMVSYTVDGGVYTLTTVTNAPIGNTDYTGLVVKNASNLKYDASKEAVVGTAATYDVAADAMVVLYDGTDYTYMTGADLMTKNDIAFDDAYMAIDGSEIGALFAVISGTVTSGDDVYGYITKVYEAENADGDTVLYVDVITVDGKKFDVETNKTTGIAAGNIVTFIMDGDVMKVESNVTYRTGAVTEAADNHVVINDDHHNTRYMMANDTVVIGIVTSDAGVEFAGTDVVEADGLTFNGDGSVASYYDNAKYTVDGEDIDVIIVETADNKGF